MAKKRISRIYMLEVRNNASQTEAVNYLVKGMVNTIEALCKGSKTSLNIVEKEDR